MPCPLALPFPFACADENIAPPTALSDASELAPAQDTRDDTGPDGRRRGNLSVAWESQVGRHHFAHLRAEQRPRQFATRGSERKIKCLRARHAPMKCLCAR